jgi:L-fucose dehydrogenase
MAFPIHRKKLKSVVAKIAFGRRKTMPDEIAAMVVFLLSAKAGHIMGQFLIADGGMGNRALT